MSIEDTPTVDDSVPIDGADEDEQVNTSSEDMDYGDDEDDDGDIQFVELTETFKEIRLLLKDVGLGRNVTAENFCAYINANSGSQCARSLGYVNKPVCNRLDYFYVEETA